MKKTNLSIFFILIFSAIGFAQDMQTLKIDFLQGNYRRVIFEGRAQINEKIGDDLIYILGLSYLKENNFDSARECFQKILDNRKTRLKHQASLGLGDTALFAGNFQEAQVIYEKLIQEPNCEQKAAVLYRLSQLEAKKGNTQKAADYLSKLRKEFPLSPELRLVKGLDFTIRNHSPEANLSRTINEVPGYSVQIGFFSSSSNANKLKERLSAKNFPAYVEKSTHGYRVKVGSFRNEEEASAAAQKLSKKGFPTKICQ